MLNQETLFQLIFKEQWKDMLDALYTHRGEIKNDVLLSHAASTFEHAFFSKLNQYPEGEQGLLDYLDTLYVLHNGRFYQLSDGNYKQLIMEIVKRKPSAEAVNYARIFPNEPECKHIIKEDNDRKAREKIEEVKKITPMNWTEIFNRLFELINDQGDTATYFSGPKFINLVRETEPYFPDYTQFIQIRNRQGKSTSRKIFFYDILLELREDSRKNVLKRMFELLRPFKGQRVEEIEVLLGWKNAPIQPGLFQPPNQQTKSVNPKVFISYSWDNEDHKQWVLDLANRLRKNGINVILDRYYLTAGKSITHFVENALRAAERIIIVFTPNYKLKSDKRAGGVGYEYSIINNGLYQNQTENDRIIPILRSGSLQDSIPDFMQQYIHLDLTNDATFENSFKDLLREIYNEPAISIPEIGEKPDL